MKLRIRKFLETAAAQMPQRQTAIKGYHQTIKDDLDRKIKAGKTRSARLQEFTFKIGFKPVNNYRTLKKVYAKGGALAVIKAVEQSKSIGKNLKQAV